MPLYKTPRLNKSYRKNQLELKLLKIENFVANRFVQCNKGCPKNNGHLPDCNVKTSVITHLSLSGGVFSIPRGDKLALDGLYKEMEVIKQRNPNLRVHPSIGRYDTLVEATYQDPKIKMYADLDFVLKQELTEDQAVVISHQFVALLSKHLEESFVKPDLNHMSSFGAKPKGNDFKNGFHILFPELVVTKDQAMMIRDQVVNDWNSEVWQYGIDKLGDQFDRGVYNNGIRLNASCKPTDIPGSELLHYTQQLQAQYPDYKRTPTKKYNGYIYKIIHQTKPEYDSMTSIKILYHGDTTKPLVDPPVQEMTERGKELLERFERSKRKADVRELTKEEKEWEKQYDLQKNVFSLFRKIGGYGKVTIIKSVIERSKERTGCIKTVRKYIVNSEYTGEHCGFCNFVHQTPSFTVLVYEKDVSVVCTRQIYKSHYKEIGKLPYVIYGRGVTFDPPGVRTQRSYWKKLIDDNNPLSIPYEIRVSDTKEVPDIEPYCADSKRRFQWLHASTGRFKTGRVEKFINDARAKGPKRILSLSGLRSVANKLADQFKLDNYLEHDYNRSLVFDEDQLVCSVESLWKLDQSKLSCDIFIIDENVYILRKFGSDTIESKKLRAIWRIFIKLLMTARNVILMDADLDKAAPKMMEIIQEGYKLAPLSKPIDSIVVHVDDYVKNNSRYEYIIGDFNTTMSLMEDIMDKNVSFAVCCSHHNDADKIAHKIADVRDQNINDGETPELVFIHGKTGNGSSKGKFGTKLMTHPDQVLSKCKALVMTPALVNAISIEGGRFKNIFCFARFGSIHYRDVLQQIARIRNTSDTPINVFVGLTDSKMSINTDRDVIFDALDQRKPYYLEQEIFKEIVSLQSKVRDDLLSKHLVDIHVDNVCSNNNLKDNLIREIRETGGKIVYLDDWCIENEADFEIKNKKRKTAFDKRYTHRKRTKKDDFDIMVIESPNVSREKYLSIKRKSETTIEEDAIVKRQEIIDVFGKEPNLGNMKVLSRRRNQQVALNAMKMKNVTKSDMEEIGLPEPKRKDWTIRDEMSKILLKTMGFESLEDRSTEFTTEVAKERAASFGELVRKNDDLKMKIQLLDKMMNVNNIQLDQVKILFGLCGRKFITNGKTKRENGKVQKIYALFDALRQ